MSTNRLDRLLAELDARAETVEARHKILLEIVDDFAAAVEHDAIINGDPPRYLGAHPREASITQRYLRHNWHVCYTDDGQQRLVWAR